MKLNKELFELSYKDDIIKVWNVKIKKADPDLLKNELKKILRYSLPYSDEIFSNFSKNLKFYFLVFYKNNYFVYSILGSNKYGKLVYELNSEFNYGHTRTIQFWKDFEDKDLEKIFIQNLDHTKIKNNIELINHYFNIILEYKRYNNITEYFQEVIYALFFLIKNKKENPNIKSNFRIEFNQFEKMIVRMVRSSTLEEFELMGDVLNVFKKISYPRYIKLLKSNFKYFKFILAHSDHNALYRGYDYMLKHNKENWKQFLNDEKLNLNAPDWFKKKHKDMFLLENMGMFDN